MASNSIIGIVTEKLSVPIEAKNKRFAQWERKHKNDRTMDEG